LTLNAPLTQTSQVNRHRHLVDDRKINTHVGIY
jgi:hypothetical protein